jgi:hypothetical protein
MNFPIKTKKPALFGNVGHLGATLPDPKYGAVAENQGQHLMLSNPNKEFFLCCAIVENRYDYRCTS